MSEMADLRRNYRAAFLRYLPSQDEAALHVGYQIGRSAVSDGLSMLDLAQVHHDVFLEALTETAPGELEQVAAAASDFFLQVLATYDMAQRALPHH
ncbi:MAG: phosphatase RsbU N-terminal domain-containing protein [Propionibacteriaceae bacterium]